MSARASTLHPACIWPPDRFFLLCLDLSVLLAFEDCVIHHGDFFSERVSNWIQGLIPPSLLWPPVP